MVRANVGVLNGGVGRNTIAPSAFMMIDIRGENDTVAEYMENKVLSAAKGAAQMFENELKIEKAGGTISASADDVAMEIVRKCSGKVGWFDEIHLEGSMGGSDDASEMLRRVQKNGGIGSYIGLGADFAAGFHHSEFDFDEAVMLPSIELLAEIICDLHSSGNTK
jgi:aminobenzoyl-glutamate utilization protein A